MNKTKLVTYISLFSLGLSSLIFLSSKVNKNIVSVKAASLPTTINLNSVSESDVRSYYDSLNSLEESELKGTNLLKNLKPILSNNFVYYSYDKVWNIYEITDRNWDLSPASSTTYGTYDEASNTITNYSYYSKLSEKKNNPYVHLLYLNDNDDPDKALRIQDSHSASSSNPDAINREHCWPQSYGFKASSGASGPAGTDVHHLIAADGQVNSIAHNNYTYGNVTSNDETWQAIVDNRSRVSGNKRMSTTVTYSEGYGESTYIFEPQDSDKGDIARALFYMCAKYNNYAGETGAISEFDPFLALSDYIYKDGTSISSSDTSPATYGMISVLLQWNELDPPDEYEIYRNDLIYRNYQFNRNPFIDFPSWADHIWGTQVGKASPSSDPLNTFEEDTRVLESISIETNPTKVTYTEGETFSITGAKVNATFDNGDIEDITSKLSYNKKALTINDSGAFTLTYTHNGISKSVSVTIQVNKKAVDYTYFLYIGIGALGVITSLIITLIVQHNKYKKKSNRKKKK